jgi:hypothetical protein
VQGETVASVGSAGPAGTAAQDFETIVKPLLKANEATFIIFALDAEGRSLYAPHLNDARRPMCCMLTQTTPR